MAGLQDWTHEFAHFPPQKKNQQKQCIWAIPHFAAAWNTKPREHLEERCSASNKSPPIGDHWFQTWKLIHWVVTSKETSQTKPSDFQRDRDGIFTATVGETDPLNPSKKLNMEWDLTKRTHGVRSDRDILDTQGLDTQGVNSVGPFRWRFLGLKTWRLISKAFSWFYEQTQLGLPRNVIKQCEQDIVGVVWYQKHTCFQQSKWGPVRKLMYTNCMYIV